MLSSNNINAHFGETVLLIGPEGTAVATHSLDDFDADLVILSGFEIKTDIEQPEEYPTEYDPALGYTSRGFGMAVELDEDNALTVQGSVRWGPRDRDDMNAAMNHAETQLTVWWTALQGVGTHQDQLVFASQDLNHEPPNSEQFALTEQLNWDDSGPGVSALSSFDLNLYDTDGGDGGDYLRSFGVEIDVPSDASSPTSMSGEILTSNAIELGTMSMDFEANLVWLPTPDGRIQTQTHKGIHEIGVHKFDVLE